MFAKTVLGGALAVAALVGAAPAALASAQDDQLAVQLNLNTAVDSGQANVYHFDEKNIALGNCPGGKGVFSSSALTFSQYQNTAPMGFGGNLMAIAQLKPGVGAGAYKLAMTCGAKSISADFTVPEQPYVQLNKNTAALSGLANIYQLTGKNLAFGLCPGGKGVFSSAVLTFGPYIYGPGADAVMNVQSIATLKPGIGAGTYKLSMTGGNTTVSDNFTVPGKQVTTTPVGAPETGGGATATVFA